MNLVRFCFIRGIDSLLVAHNEVRVSEIALQNSPGGLLPSSGKMRGLNVLL